jgi:hypothetical protein
MAKETSRRSGRVGDEQQGFCRRSEISACRDARRRLQVSSEPQICCDALYGDAQNVDAPKLESWQTPDPRSMYITDVAHFLDKSGAISPLKDPACALAQFQVDLVAHASGAAGHAQAAPRCFKCKKSAVNATPAYDDAVVCARPACQTEGRISNWQGSLSDLCDPPPSLG